MRDGSVPLQRLSRASTVRRSGRWPRVALPSGPPRPPPPFPCLFVRPVSSARPDRPQQRSSALALPHGPAPAPSSRRAPALLEARRTPTPTPGLALVPALATPPPRHLGALPPLDPCALCRHYWLRLLRGWPHGLHFAAAYGCKAYPLDFPRVFPLLSAARPPPLCYVSLRFSYETRRARGLRTTRSLRTRPTIA